MSVLPICTKRIYEPAAATDGYRLLVDRLWPRGISRERAALHQWYQELAPSTELRRWYAHEPARYEVFKRRYREELKERTALLQEVVGLARQQAVTLLYATRSPQNQAVVLREVLLELAAAG